MINELKEAINCIISQNMYIDNQITLEDMNSGNCNLGEGKRGKEDFPINRMEEYNEKGCNVVMRNGIRINNELIADEAIGYKRFQNQDNTDISQSGFLK